jgi:hypothetical protein
MSLNFGIGLNLDLFSMILNNKSKTWKSQGLFFHVLRCKCVRADCDSQQMVQALRPGAIGTFGGKIICADKLNKPEYWRE